MAAPYREVLEEPASPFNHLNAPPFVFRAAAVFARRQTLESDFAFVKRYN
jgi:hypothetical protein